MPRIINLIEGFNWGDLPQTDLSAINWPNFSPYILPAEIIVGLIIAGYGGKKMLDHAIIFATPEDAGWGGMVYRGTKQKEQRPKRDREGNIVMITAIGEDGKEIQTPEMETIEVVSGKLLGEIVYWPGMWVDSDGNICPLGQYYDATKGFDVRVKDGYYYDPVKKGQVRDDRKYNPETKKDEPIGAGPEGAPESKIERKENQDWWKNFAHRSILTIPKAVKYPIKQLEQHFAIYYIGRIPILDKVPYRDIRWTERAGPKEPAHERRVRRRWNKLTQISMAIDLDGVEELGGYRWKLKLTFFWEIRNLRDAWVYIPNSADQAASQFASAAQDFWRRRQILQYADMVELDGIHKPSKLSPEQIRDVKPIDEGLLSEQMLKYFKKTGVIKDVRKKFGRLLTKIAIDDMSLEPPYDKLFTDVRTAGIKARADVIRAVGEEQSKRHIAEGNRAMLDPYVKSGRVGAIFALKGGVDTATRGKLSSSIDDLVAVTLLSDAREALRGKKPREKT